MGQALKLFLRRAALSIWVLGAGSLVFAQDTRHNETGHKESGDDDSSRPPAVEVLDPSGYKRMVLHRVTIVGTARNRAGKPIAGAEVFVASTPSFSPSGFVRLRGTTKADQQGRFTFQDVQLLVNRRPAPKPTEARFMVFGVMKGYAFTWHRSRSFRPQARPTDPVADDPDPEATQQAFYHGEEIRTDLDFELAATLRGRVTDDLGRPIANARVQVGRIENVRDPRGSGLWICRHAGADGDTNDSFAAITTLPAQYREALTDAEGIYALRSLRRETMYLTQIIPSLAHNAEQRNVFTTRHPVHSGYAITMDQIFVAPRDVVVAVTDTLTKQPVSGVVVTAHHKADVRRGGVRGTTDELGIANLSLLPGDYDLFVEPTSDGWLFHRRMITIPADPTTTQLDVNVDPAAIVELKVTDAETGKPIAGLMLNHEATSHQLPQRLSSNTVYKDYSTTNREGELRVSIQPGQRRFRAISDNYVDAAGSRPDMLDLVAGKTIQVQLRLRRRANDANGDSTSVFPESYPRDLAAHWQAQNRLASVAQVRVKMRTANSDNPDVQPDKLLQAIKADHAVCPDFPAILDAILGGKIKFIDKVLTVDGPRRREDRFYVDESRGALLSAAGVPLPAEASIFNGVDQIDYREASHQASIGSNYLLTKLTDLWQHPPTRQADVLRQQSNRESPTLSVAKTDDEVMLDFVWEQGYHRRFVCDKESGFVYQVLSGPSAKNFTHLELYYAPTIYGDGLVIPQATASVRVRDDKVQTIEIKMIDAVEILKSFSPQDFALPLPAGCQLLDHRDKSAGRQSKPERYILRSEVSDALSYLHHLAN